MFPFLNWWFVGNPVTQTTLEIEPTSIEQKMKNGFIYQTAMSTFHEFWFFNKKSNQEILFKKKSFFK